MNCSKARDQYKNSELLFTGKIVSKDVSVYIISLYLISAPSNINQDIFKEKQRETTKEISNFSSREDDIITKEFGSRKSISLTDKTRNKISRKKFPFKEDSVEGVNNTQQKRKSNNSKPGLRGAERKREDESLIRDQFESKKLNIETSEEPPSLPSYDKRRAKYKREKIFRLHKNPTRFSFRILRQKTGASSSIQSH